MQFGYTIIYTNSVEESIEFFEKAFGFKRRFIHESGYGELESGTTALAFATHNLGISNLPNGYIKVDEPKPLGIEIALISSDVQASYKKAIACGAKSLKEPMQKPWGQEVAYIRCPNGTLVEICSPVGV